VRAPTPGRRQSPFQRCLLCRTRAGAKGCAPPRQPRTATCDLSADAPHQATARTSHGTAAAMRARISGPSITHSSNKAWRTGDFGPSNVALLVGQWVLPGRQNSVRRGRKPREKSKIDQTLRSGSFEFDLCQKSRGSSPKRTNSIPASRFTAYRETSRVSKVFPDSCRKD
jgi:hypothetical protein